MFNSMDAADAGVSKRERTRTLIADAAVASFRDRGYEDTTIRLLAGQLGISTGNAYHHFPTKNHLVQELYLRVQEEHREAVVEPLRMTDDLIERLSVVYHRGLDTLEPFHKFAPGFLSAAMSPRSPINPLGPDSQPARDAAVAIFTDAVRGSRKGFAPDFDDQLPELLLLAYLLLALFWVYDTSPNQQRSHRLIDRGLALLKLSMPLVKLPLVRAPLRQFFDMVSEVRA
ncbi:MAG TPA: TetR family transcriptional regulator [Pseudolysinimonas sp.]|nr:TetR family transcriptional regulator [Pseudolysinimonas sp.]